MNTMKVQSTDFAADDIGHPLADLPSLLLRRHVIYALAVKTIVRYLLILSRFYVIVFVMPRRI